MGSGGTLLTEGHMVVADTSVDEGDTADPDKDMPCRTLRIRAYSKESNNVKVELTG